MSLARRAVRHNCDTRPRRRVMAMPRSVSAQIRAFALFGLDELEEPEGIRRSLETDHETDAQPVVGSLERVGPRFLRNFFENFCHRRDQRTPVAFPGLGLGHFRNLLRLRKLDGRRCHLRRPFRIQH